MAYSPWVGKRVRATRTETLTGEPEKCEDESHQRCAVIGDSHLSEMGDGAWHFERLPDGDSEYEPGDVV